jgi:hypothetical protein
MSLRRRYQASALRMRVMFSNFVYVTFAIFFASCGLASAKIPVNVDDLDPLLECKRRDVGGNGHARYRYKGLRAYFPQLWRAITQFICTVSVSTPEHMRGSLLVLVFVGGQSWVKNGTEVSTLQGSSYIHSYIASNSDPIPNHQSVSTLYTYTVQTVDHYLPDHYLRVVDFTTSRKLSDPSIMTTIDIPSDVPIFMMGAFWVDGNTAYVVSGQVNDEPWLSRQGEFLPSNYTKGLGGGTVYTCDLESGKW